MSAVGILGEFLVNHQVVIDALLLILLAALVIWLLAKRFWLRPKKESEMQALIDKVNRLESQLAERDGAPVEAEPETEAEGAKLAEPETEAEGAKLAEPEEPEAPEIEEIPEEDDFLEGRLDETIDLRALIMEEGADGSRDGMPGEKYTSRTWGEDRHGNVYTEEMLRDQIG